MPQEPRNTQELLQQQLEALQQQTRLLRDLRAFCILILIGAAFLAIILIASL